MWKQKQVTKHPHTIAWENWLGTSDGKRCMMGETSGNNSKLAASGWPDVIKKTTGKRTASISRLN